MSSSYLAGYGAGHGRRARIVKTILLTVLGLLIVGTTLFFLVRNRSEQAQLVQFLDNIKKQDYANAYRQWGCSPEQPCREYRYDMFLEDWGPKSGHAQVGSPRWEVTNSCDNGIVAVVDFPGKPEALWVERKSLHLGYAPYPYSDQRLPEGGRSFIQMMRSVVKPCKG